MLEKNMVFFYCHQIFAISVEIQWQNTTLSFVLPFSQSKGMYDPKKNIEHHVIAPSNIVSHICQLSCLDTFFNLGVVLFQVMKIMPVQKQTRAGQRTRFKAFVVVGDGKGMLGLAWDAVREVATAIRGAYTFGKAVVFSEERLLGE